MKDTLIATMILIALAFGVYQADQFNSREPIQPAPYDCNNSNKCDISKLTYKYRAECVQGVGVPYSCDLAEHFEAIITLQETACNQLGGVHKYINTIDICVMPKDNDEGACNEDLLIKCINEGEEL